MSRWELIELQDLSPGDRIELAPRSPQKPPRQPSPRPTVRLLGDTVRLDSLVWKTFRRGDGHDFQLCAHTHLTWCDLCGEFIWGVYRRSLRCVNCSYTCHSRCRPLIQLDCKALFEDTDHSEDIETDTDVVKLGEVDVELEGTEGYLVMSWGGRSAASSGYCSQDDSDSELEHFFTARTSLLCKPTILEDTVVDWRKQKQLSITELQQKVKEYNAQINSNLYMSLNRNGSYTGFIKVQFQLARPVSLPSAQSLSSSCSSLPSPGLCTSFYLPRDTTKQLHVGSGTRVREVIEALLNKFTMVDNPAKFALYERSERNGQVYVRKLCDDECPLFLRLCAGFSENTLSFILRENKTGEVNWDAFSLPELSNFLRILQREEEEHIRLIVQRYSVARDKLQEALRSFSTPG